MGQNGGMGEKNRLIADSYGLIRESGDEMMEADASKIPCDELRRSRWDAPAAAHARRLEYEFIISHTPVK